MKLNSVIRGIIIAAFAWIASSSVAIAQTPVPPEQTFLQDSGMSPVARGFYITAAERNELVTYGCTAGPTGLLRAEITRAVARREMCGRNYISRLDDHFKEGAEGYLITRMPYGFRITIYSQGINLNQNVKCFGDVPFSGLVELRLTCVNSASGQMIVAGTLSQLFGQGGAMALGAMASNITAPQAGNTNIVVGNDTSSEADAVNNGGGGAAPNIIIDVTANATGTGGAAGSNSSVVGAPVCPTTTCH